MCVSFSTVLQLVCGFWVGGGDLEQVSFPDVIVREPDGVGRIGGIADLFPGGLS